MINPYAAVPRTRTGAPGAAALTAFAVVVGTTGGTACAAAPDDLFDLSEPGDLIEFSTTSAIGDALASGELAIGPLLGSGDFHNVYAIGDDQVIKIPKPDVPNAYGMPTLSPEEREARLRQEATDLATLATAGLPTLPTEAITFTHQSTGETQCAIVQQRCDGPNSKDIAQQLLGAVPQQEEDLSRITEQTVVDVRDARRSLAEAGLDLEDAQFLVDEDHRARFIDPEGVFPTPTAVTQADLQLGRVQQLMEDHLAATEQALSSAGGLTVVPEVPGPDPGLGPNQEVPAAPAPAPVPPSTGRPAEEAPTDPSVAPVDVPPATTDLQPDTVDLELTTTRFPAGDPEPEIVDAGADTPVGDAVAAATAIAGAAYDNLSVLAATYEADGTTVIWPDGRRATYDADRRLVTSSGGTVPDEQPSTVDPVLPFVPPALPELPGEWVLSP